MYMKKIFLPVFSFAGYAILLLGILLAGGCMKPKEDNKIPYLDVTSGTPSAIRMFNFANNNIYGTEVTINNVPLTAYQLNSNGKPTGTPLGLALFPSGAWNSGENASPFSIPNSLLNKEGKAHCLLSTMTGTLDTTIENDVVHPKDYYLLQDGHLKVLERDNLPSTRAGYFKVRIINLGNPLPDLTGLKLNGPVALTYADGSAVDPLLNAVAPGVVSPYIELPYGSYQFKLFVAGGGSIDVTRQLAEFPVIPSYNYCNPGATPQEGITSQLRTFKAGGVYSIVITENNYRMLDCSKQNASALINGYRIITELDPGVNYTFARMQAVNALPGKKISILVDGKPLGGELRYAGDTENGKAILAPGGMFVQGDHQIKVTNGAGQEIASASIRLYPSDHYTIWAYEKPDGTPGILFEANEMTGSVYATNYHPNGPAAGTVPDDGANGLPRRSRYKYAWESRFLNMSPDLPYLTFTNDQQLFIPATPPSNQDTLRFTTAYVNLPSGQQPFQNVSMIYSLPFISAAQGNNPEGNSEMPYFPKKIRAYRSVPGNIPQVPGSLLGEIAPLDVLQACVANDKLYTDPALKIPETGVYTIALVGRTSANAPATEKAKIIVIKHNQ